jgi:hypothetical protein
MRGIDARRIGYGLLIGFALIAAAVGCALVIDAWGHAQLVERMIP